MYVREGRTEREMSESGCCHGDGGVDEMTLSMRISHDDQQTSTRDQTIDPVDGRTVRDSACMSLNEWSELFRRTAGRPPSNLLQAYITSTFSRHDCHVVFSGNPRWPQMLANFKTSLFCAYCTGFACQYRYIYEGCPALSTQRKPDRFTYLVSLLPGRQICWVKRCCRYCFLSVRVSVSLSLCLSSQKHRRIQDFRSGCTMF